MWFILTPIVVFIALSWCFGSSLLAGLFLVFIVVFALIRAFSGSSLVLEYPWWLLQTEELECVIEGPVQNGAIFSKIRGVTRTNENGQKRQDLVANLIKGESLQMRIDKTRNYPLTIYNNKGKELGFVIEKHSDYLVDLIERGCPIGVVVKEVTGGVRGKPSRGCNIRFTNIRMKVLSLEEEDFDESEWRVRIIAKAPPRKIRETMEKEAPNAS